MVGSPLVLLSRMSKRKTDSQVVSYEPKHAEKKHKPGKAVVMVNAALVEKALNLKGPGRFVWFFGSGADWVRWRCLNKSWRAMSNKMSTEEILLAGQFSLEEFHEMHITRLKEHYDTVISKAGTKVVLEFNKWCKSCKTVLVRNKCDSSKCYACEARDKLCEKYEDETCENRDTAIAFCRALVSPPRCKFPSII
jgi:hypothetical protein